MGSSPLAIGRSRFTGCSRSWGASRTSFARYDGARGRAVRDEGHAGLEPQARVAELAREQQAREQEEVLRPLARAQRDERGAPDRARYGDGGHGHRPDGRRQPAAAQSVAPLAPPGGLRATQEGGITGRRRSNRLPVPSSLSSSIRPPSATASSRAIASPSPVPPPSRDQNGRKIRSRSAGLIPGPVSATETETAPLRCGERELDPAAVGRPAEGVGEQVGDDLEHAVAVGDDHRAPSLSQR